MFLFAMPLVFHIIFYMHPAYIYLYVERVIRLQVLHLIYERVVLICVALLSCSCSPVDQ